MHDSSSESDSISLVVTNRNLNTQQSQYFDALDTIEENEEESTDDDLSDLDVSFYIDIYLAYSKMTMVNGSERKSMLERICLCPRPG